MRQKLYRDNYNIKHYVYYYAQIFEQRVFLPFKNKSRCQLKASVFFHWIASPQADRNDVTGKSYWLKKPYFYLILQTKQPQ